MKTTTIRKIALRQLAMSPKNVRTVQTSEDDDAMLEASIATHGLEQNLGVELAADNLFLVVFGGRRYRALNRLCASGVIDGDYKVPCRVMDEDEALEASIAENVARVAMHPADEFDAFNKLIEAGSGERDIADRFGVTLVHVQKRMKLARVSPAILDRYRKGDLTLEALTAFALTTSHDRQNDALTRIEQYLGTTYHDVPGIVRRILTETSVLASSRLGRFVGVEAYEAAGGNVTRDLFSTSSDCYLDDGGLLETLAIDKLNNEAKALGGQWRWIDVMLDMPWSATSAYGRVYPDAVPCDPDPAHVAELETVSAKIDEIEDRADDCDDDVAEYEALYARQEELVDLTTRPTTVYTDEARALAGGILSLDQSGNPKFEGGLIRLEDMPKRDEPEALEAADEQTETRTDADAPTSETDDDGETVASIIPSPAPLRIEPPRAATSAYADVDSKVDAPQTVALKEAGLSASLGDDLRAIRHQVMQAHLVVDFDLSFDLMVYSMCLDAFGLGYSAKPLDVRLTRAMVTGSRPHLDGTVAERMLGKIKDSLNLSWMELPKPDDFKALSALQFEEKQALFCFAASHALVQQLSVDHAANPVIEEAGRRLDVDVATCWRPTAADFFKRVTKDHMLTAAREIISDAWAEEHKGLKKGQLADAMESAFSEDARSRAGLRAETVERTARWLPNGMGFATGEVSDAATEKAEDSGQDANGASDPADRADDETSSETPSSDPTDDEDLPAFLTTAAA